MNHDPILAALGNIARIVSESLELRDVLGRVAGEAKSVLPLDWMAIARIEESGTLTLYSQTGPRPDPLRSVTLEDFSPTLRSSWGCVFRTGNVRAASDPAYFVDREMLQRETASLLTAPLHRGEQIIGFVGVDSRNSDAFSEEHETVLLSIAALLSLALEHERLSHQDLVRRQRIDAVDALLPIVAGALNVREVFEQVSSTIKPILAHDHLMLLSTNADGTLVQLDAYSGDLSGVLPASGPNEGQKRFPAGMEYQIIKDVSEIEVRDEKEREFVAAMQIGSALRLPIHLEGAPESTLNFISKVSHKYCVDDVPIGRRVADIVSLALSHRRLAEEEQRAALLEQRVETLTAQLETTRGMHRIVGQSKKWRSVLAEVAHVAPTETTVLLTGESGTGKEILARLIHRGSPRAKGPFVAINCAALPETLLESELFGHERGAFTGATHSRAGSIEQASGGVLFLDEVGEMSPQVQAKVLRVLEQREFMRIGGTRVLRANVRLVAATNRDLAAALAVGGFRKDLYYRLRVFEIVAPGLRERKEDIFLLAEAFLEELAGVVGRPAGGLSREAKEALMAYPWPGNARELRNVLERATILCGGGLITLAHLPSEVARIGGSPAPEPGRPLSGTDDLESNERALIAAALKRAGANRSEAARILGITRSTLYSKILKHGLDPKSSR